MASDQDVLHADLSELLTILGMGDHARPQSPHEVFQEALRVLRERIRPRTEEDITQAMIQAGREALEEAAQNAESRSGEFPIGAAAAAERVVDDIRALAATPPEARQTETGWKPIEECPPDTRKIIGWCTYFLGAEARACQRTVFEGQTRPWQAYGVSQTVTHFKPWPEEGPPPPAIGNLEGEGRS